MTVARARSEPPDWLFDPGRHRSLTRDALAAAGLAWQPLADVRLTLAQYSRSGQWHLAPGVGPGPGTCQADGEPAARPADATVTICEPPRPRDRGRASAPDGCVAPPADGSGEACARARRAAARGRALRVREAGLLDCNDLCAGCAAGLAVPGPEGTYWRLARLIVASGDWVTALEHAAQSADWLACSRWTAYTPFTDPRPFAALITALAGNRQWATCAAAACAAQDQLRHRAEAAWELARQTVGPPGFRAVAACACALTRAEPETRAESRSIAAITGQAGSYDDNLRPWAIASRAWLDAVARDGNPAAGKQALRDALLAAYAGAPVRDLVLLPAMATSQSEDGYSSAAEWAQADYRAVLHLVADAWSDRLDADLAMMLDPPSGLWQLLLVLGWPLTDDADEDLAYLASYPEHARIRDPGCCGVACGRRHDSWAVVLHVPVFAVTHALTHDSAHLDVIPGPQLPSGAQPSPEQIQELLSRAHDKQ